MAKSDSSKTDRYYNENTNVYLQSKYNLWFLYFEYELFLLNSEYFTVTSSYNVHVDVARVSFGDASENDGMCERGVLSVNVIQPLLLIRSL